MLDLFVVLKSANLQGEKLGFRDLGDHPRQLFLHELVRGDGLVAKLFAQQGILERGVITRHRSANCAPGNAIPSLIETHER